MGVVTHQIEFTYAIPPARLFKAMILDGDNLIPKLMPQAFKNVEIIEGDGGAGTIKIITFGEGSQFKYAKHKIEAIDKDNFAFNFSIIEGDILTNVVEKIYHEIKYEESPNGGSICMDKSTYFTIGDCKLTEEQLNEGKEKSNALFKVVEAYLLANPDAYN